VDAKEIDAQIAAMKGRYKSPEEYQQALAAQKLTEADLRRDVEGQLYAQGYANSVTRA